MTENMVKGPSRSTGAVEESLLGKVSFLPMPRCNPCFAARHLRQSCSGPNQGQALCPVGWSGLNG